MYTDPLDDTDLPAAWAYLHAVLATLGRPPVLDRRGQEHPAPEPPRPGDCIVHLGLPEGRWGVALAGALALEPGAVVWALCPGWLTREGGSLLCRRAVWADRGGQLYLDDLRPPRPVTYFSNHLTPPDTYGQRADGEPLEGGISIPQSSCVEISRFVACKVTTRLLAEAVGVEVPWSLALLTRPLPPGIGGSRSSRVRLMDGAHALLSLAGGEGLALLTARLQAELASWPAWVERVVVKPSGPMHLMTRGVTLHPRAAPEEIARAALALLRGEGGAPFSPGDSVLIDAFVGGRRSAVRIRAIVARLDDRRASLQATLATEGPAGRPISGVTGWPQTLPQLLANRRVPDAQAEALLSALRSLSAGVLLAVADAEPHVPTKPGARTELLGLDFVMALPGDTGPGQGALRPTLVEVNNHDCTDLLQIYGATVALDPRRGAPSPNAGLLDEALRAAAHRSQRGRLRGKRLLLIGGMIPSKRRVWEAARAAGVRLVIVAGAVPDPALGLGSEVEGLFVLPELAGPRGEGEEQALALRVADAARALPAPVDGVLTVWEDDAVLAARVAAALGLRGHPLQAQRAAKSKRLTTLALMAPLPDMIDSVQPNPATLAIPFVDVERDLTPADLEATGLPAVVRVSCGSSAVGTRVVYTFEEAQAVVRDLRALVEDPAAAEARYPGCGFAFGPGLNRVIVSAFADGSEHDVDLLLFDGAVVDAVVIDNGETEPPRCAETCSLTPSALPEARQAQLIAAAAIACRALGLTDGVVNVELKLGPGGPRVLEVNARMAGFYVPTFVREAWGLDLPVAAMMIACGIRPVGRVRRLPERYVAGAQVFAGDKRGPLPAGVLEVDLGAHGLDPLFPEPVATLGFVGATAAAAVEAARAQLPEALPGRSDLLAARLGRLL